MNKFVNERKRLGLTQKQLAEQLGVTKNYISDVETGLKNPGIKLAKRMEALTGVKWYEFLNKKN